MLRLTLLHLLRHLLKMPNSQQMLVEWDEEGWKPFALLRILIAVPKILALKGLLLQLETLRCKLMSMLWLLTPSLDKMSLHIYVFWVQLLTRLSPKQASQMNLQLQPNTQKLSLQLLELVQWVKTIAQTDRTVYLDIQTLSPTQMLRDTLMPSMKMPTLQRVPKLKHATIRVRQRNYLLFQM